MEKKKILYVSPFLPMQSGISDYSEVMVEGLKEHFDVTLLIDNYKLDNINLHKNFDVKNYKKDYIKFEVYDEIIYNMGNNPQFHSYMYELIREHPGYVILHDYSLFYLTAGYYQDRNSLFSKIYELEGAEGINTVKDALRRYNTDNILECKDIASKLLLNQEVLKEAKGIIVHSYYTKNKLEELGYNSILKINMVNMGEDLSTKETKYLKETYGIPEDVIVIGSFGYIASTKQNHLMCQAINYLNENTDFDIYYVMVGQGDYVDEYLGKHIIKTGFIPREAYDEILNRTDIVCNLRYPTMGETSISLIHAMGREKVCMITDDAWFAEIPDECVVKININDKYVDVAKRLQNLLENQNEIEQIGIRAKKYVDSKCNIAHIANEISRYLTLENRKGGK